MLHKLKSKSLGTNIIGNIIGLQALKGRPIPSRRPTNIGLSWAACPSHWVVVMVAMMIVARNNKLVVVVLATVGSSARQFPGKAQMPLGISIFQGEPGQVYVSGSLQGFCGNRESSFGKRKSAMEMDDE